MSNYLKFNYSIAIKRCLSEVRGMSSELIGDRKRLPHIFRAINIMEMKRLEAERSINSNKVVKNYTVYDKIFYTSYKAKLMSLTDEMVKRGQERTAKEIRRIISGILDKSIINESKLMKAKELFLKPTKESASFLTVYSLGEEVYRGKMNKYLTTKEINYHVILHDLISELEDFKVKRYLLTKLDLYEKSNKNKSEYDYAKEFCEGEMYVTKNYMLGVDTNYRSNIRKAITEVIQPRINQYKKSLLKYQIEEKLNKKYGINNKGIKLEG